MFSLQLGLLIEICFNVTGLQSLRYVTEPRAAFPLTTLLHWLIGGIG
jgi:hypothetical protein